MFKVIIIHILIQCLKFYQVYEGLVYMDFNKELMQSKNHGLYESLPTHNLPKFWLAYLANPSDSGNGSVLKKYYLVLSIL